MATGKRMNNYPFPSFNHPFYPDGGHQQSFVDYGSISTLNVGTNVDGGLVTSSRHKHYDEGTRGVRVVGAHPTIPLLAPCKTVFTSKTFPEQRNHGFSRTNFKQTLVEQASDFCRDHSDIAFQSSIVFVDEELHCKPWDSKCVPTMKKLQTSSVAYKRRHLNPNNKLDRFCDLFVTDPVSKYIGLMKEHIRPLPKGLCEAMHDIPPKLLFDLLNESIEQQKNEMLFFDILQGNTLGYCSIPHLDSQSVDGILFYPGGPSLEVLNASFVGFENSDNPSNGTRTLYRRPNILPSSKDIEVTGPIRQISAISHEYGGTFVATRSRYNCSFFSITTTNDSSEITMKSIDSIDSEDQPVSLALSPFVPGEGIVAMETGQVCMWRSGKKVETRSVPSVAPKEKWPWYQCIYASHPRCILIANSIEADIMDFRASGLFSRNLFSITSKQVSIVERISAIQRNPLNTHHYFIATDQSLMIMDDRFIQHPVLKWRHHLQDPVQFIEVIPNAIPDCEDTVVVVSGSQHHETHCYQYNNGEYEVRHTFPLSGNTVMNPPLSTVLPWKVSSYNEWPSLLPTSVLPISSVLEDRLADPLVGVCSIAMTSQESNKGFTVLQMSASGDIFYQPFIPGKAGKGRDLENLSDKDLAFCKDWIHGLIAMDQEDLKLNKWPLESNRIETDCGDLFKKMISLNEPHQSCVLCIDDTCTADYDATQDELDNDEVSVCPRCGIDIKYGRQLKQSQAIDNIVCCEKMKSGIQSDNLNLTTNADSFQDPLSKNLLRNWILDTPVPLNLGTTGEKDEEPEIPITSSDTNLIDEENHEDTKDVKSEKNPQSNEVFTQELNQPDKTQSFESPLEVPSTNLTPTTHPWLHSSSKNVSPVKSVKRIKRKLNQSIGF